MQKCEVFRFQSSNLQLFMLNIFHLLMFFFYQKLIFTDNLLTSNQRIYRNKFLETKLSISQWIIFLRITSWLLEGNKILNVNVTFFQMFF